MAFSDSLGDRMKEYEAVTRHTLIRRTPVIIRIDGRAFHTYTKAVVRADPSTKSTPFSAVMHSLMVNTTETLVREVQGCVLGYTQSDEISLVLKDWTTIETQPWFGYVLPKVCSVSASIATMAFNAQIPALDLGLPVTATFDARAYNLPVHEVTNYLIWRQQDASRNSVQMFARFYFSHKELHNKSNSQIMDMLINERGVSWNDLPTWCKRGTCVVRSCGDDKSITVDENIPVFTQDREYVGNLME